MAYTFFFSNWIYADVLTEEFTSWCAFPSWKAYREELFF